MREVLVNGKTWIDASSVAPHERLLDVLRDRYKLTGTKEACGRGECGACTVLIDGAPVLSCITLAARVTGEVTTIEGVVDEANPLREAFAECGAFQCGFCTPGQIVRGTALLREGLPVDDRELRRQMSGNVCRCTGYNGIIEALRRVAASRDGRPAMAPNGARP